MGGGRGGRIYTSVTWGLLTLLLTVKQVVMTVQLKNPTAIELLQARLKLVPGEGLEPTHPQR